MGDAACAARKALALFVAALALCIAPQASACTDPFDVAVAHGDLDFVQTRRLSGVRVPLVSRGRVTINAQSVDWRVTEPVEVLTHIGADGITQSVDGGAPEPVGAQGASFVTTTGLIDLLNGNFEALRANYDIAQSTGANGGWSMRLTPLADSLAQYVASIDVRGCERVDSVEVHQANGDSMSITLSPVG